MRADKDQDYFLSTVHGYFLYKEARKDSQSAILAGLRKLKTELKLVKKDLFLGGGVVKLG